MTPPRVSIVMTAYKRAPLLENTLVSIFAQRMKLPYYVEVIVVEDGDDGGATRAICNFGDQAIHLQRLSRPDVAYSNQARVINRGLKAATGDVIILQNAECYHQGDVIAPLVAMVDHTNAVFASCLALNADGSHQQWYCHPLHNRRPYFFCGAMTRDNFLKLGGFEESFTGYGFEDDDFSERMLMAGIGQCITPEVTVLHQWHPPFTDSMDEGASHLARLRSERQGYVANIGREWGVTP